MRANSSPPRQLWRVNSSVGARSAGVAQGPVGRWVVVATRLQEGERGEDRCADEVQHGP